MGLLFKYRRSVTLALVIGLAAGTGAEAASARHASTRPHHHRAHHRPQIGKASYYGPHHAGRTMANGKPMAPTKMVAASKTLPLGTKARVTNLETGKSVRVVVADRGPYARGRIIDVSSKAAEKLDMKKDGVADVKVTPISIPKPDDAKPAAEAKPSH
jgi:rare lipoprotein A